MKKTFDLIRTSLTQYADVSTFFGYTVYFTAALPVAPFFAFINTYLGISFITILFSVIFLNCTVWSWLIKSSCCNWFWNCQIFGDEVFWLKCILLVTWKSFIEDAPYFYCFILPWSYSHPTPLTLTFTLTPALPLTSRTLTPALTLTLTLTSLTLTHTCRYSLQCLFNAQSVQTACAYRLSGHR